MLFSLAIGYFNPRPREKGDAVADCIEYVNAYFNPRPREKGDIRSIGNVIMDFPISIHALVKRATEFPDVKSAFYVISIHALVKRATLYFKYFMLYNIISIHALVKRATANLYNDYLYFEAKYHISDIFPQ